MYGESSYIGILFSIVVSFSVSVFSFLAFFRRPRGLHSGRLAFVLFWFLMGFVWLATGAADLLAYFQYRDLSFDATYVLQIFVGGSLIAAAYFLADFLFKGKGRWFVTILYVLAYAGFLVTLFTFDLTPRDQSFFSTQNISPDITLFIFTGMFIPLWVGSFILMVKMFRENVSSPEHPRMFLMLGALSLILLGAAGAPDELGFVTDWAVTASRLISLVSAIVGYAATLALHDSKELVV